MLHPQDLLLALKLVAMREAKKRETILEEPSVNMVAESGRPYVVDPEVFAKERSWTYEELGRSIGISASQAHLAMKRAVESGLVRANGSIRGKAIYDTVIAAKYYFPAKMAGPSIGIATAYAAPPLKSYIRQGSDPIPVWPHPKGGARGVALEPIYKTAPEAAMKDPKLYELLAMLDALRSGRAREVNFSRDEFARILGVTQ